MSGAESVVADRVLDGIVVTNTAPPLHLDSELVAQRLTVLDATRPFVDAIADLHGATVLKR